MFMFPLGFNLNDFKNASNPGTGGSPGDLSFSMQGGPPQQPLQQSQQQQQQRQQLDDDSSTDTKPTSTNLFQTLSTFTAPNPDLINANLEKMMIADALEVVTSLPVELTASGGGGSENGMDDAEETKAELSDMDINGDDEEYLSLGDISVNTVLPDCVLPFSFKLPSSVPPYLNAHYTCETGSRLLFSSILWLGKVPVFQQLPEELQNALIKATWAEIFVLNFVQMSGQLSFNAVMTSIMDYFKSVVGSEQTPIEKVLLLSDNVCLFNEFVRDVEKLQLDDLSYAALRVILLFNARGVRRDYPNYTAQLDAVVDVASQELRRQLVRNGESNESNESTLDEMRETGAEEQFVKIIMKVCQLSKFNAAVVEELFFTNMVGQVSVENVIPYILRLGNSSNIPVSGGMMMMEGLESD